MEAEYYKQQSAKIKIEDEAKKPPIKQCIFKRLRGSEYQKKESLFKLQVNSRVTSGITIESEVSDPTNQRGVSRGTQYRKLKNQSQVSHNTYGLDFRVADDDQSENRLRYVNQAKKDRMEQIIVQDQEQDSKQNYLQNSQGSKFD